MARQQRTNDRQLKIQVWPWIKKMVEKGWQIFTKSFWEALFDKYGPRGNGY